MIPLLTDKLIVCAMSLIASIKQPCLLLFSSVLTYCTCTFLYRIVTFGFPLVTVNFTSSHYFCYDMPLQFSVRNSPYSNCIACYPTSSLCICLTHSLRSVFPYRPLNFSQQLLGIYNLSYRRSADRFSHYIYNWHSIHPSCSGQSTSRLIGN